MDCNSMDDGRGFLLPAVIVLNHKYFPDSETSAALVGSTSFALSAARSLREAGLLMGMILYQRREDMKEPTMEMATKNGTLCCIISFNFNMEKDRVKDSLQWAASKLLDAGQAGGTPLLYYQTDTLLSFHPKGIPCCVTHHGPFVADFLQHFSVEDAYRAFGSAEKAVHLMHYQQDGVQCLLHRNDIFVLQHSTLQRRFLLRCGIDPCRIQLLRPPISSAGTRSHRKTSLLCDPQVARFLECNDLLLFTAVARIDFFKNLELIVDAGVELLLRGLQVRVLLVGGEAADEELRRKTLGRVPSPYTARFMAVQKLDKDNLHALFHNTCDKAIFVCPSRYETLGITPLEAALSGVNTIIVDSEHVEASRFFPVSNRFRPTARDLADVVANKLHCQNDMRAQGLALRSHLERHMSQDMFTTDLLLAWSYFSRLVTMKSERPAHIQDSE